MNEWKEKSPVDVNSNSNPFICYLSAPSQQAVRPMKSAVKSRWFCRPVLVPGRVAYHERGTQGLGKDRVGCLWQETRTGRRGPVVGVARGSRRIVEGGRQHNAVCTNLTHQKQSLIFCSFVCKFKTLKI